MTIYPYRTQDEKNFFPIIPLIVFSGKKSIDILALIDSGAMTSIFREDVAKKLGIDIGQGKQIILSGVGGRIFGYVHKLPVRIAGKKFICPIVFSREYHISYNLLGREAFFRQFTIIFEEKKQRVRVE